MTLTPASEVSTEVSTIMVTITATDRAASTCSATIPMTLITSANTKVTTDTNSRSDGRIPANTLVAPARSPAGVTLCLPCAPGAPPARSRRLRLVSVTDAPHGHDAPGHGRVGLEFLAQPPHVHGDGRGVAERPAPHLGEQLLPGERLARVPHQEDEQVILARGQLDQLAVGPDFVRRKVHDQVAVGDGAEVELVGKAGAAGPSQHRAHAEGQFTRAKGLGDIVVRAGFEADEAIGLIAQGGQHDHRNWPACP